MKKLRTLRDAGTAACLAIGMLAVLADGALAAGTTICVPNREGGVLVTARAGACEGGYKKTTLLAEAEQEKLQAILPYLKLVKSGVDKKPTIQISGANVQIVSGAGSETAVNGVGNLIVGYDENPGKQTGSNNLILGAGQGYSSYGSVLGGYGNTVSGAYGDAFGTANSATGAYASVTGGKENKAEGEWSAVSGGDENAAVGNASSASGGEGNFATGVFASVTGGWSNEAAGEWSSVTGGGGVNPPEGNVAVAPMSSVGGGRENKASGANASVSGGQKNTAEGEFSAILGGKEITLATEWGVSP